MQQELNRVSGLIPLGDVWQDQGARRGVTLAVKGPPGGHEQGGHEEKQQDLL